MNFCSLYNPELHIETHRKLLLAWSHHYYIYITWNKKKTNYANIVHIYVSFNFIIYAFIFICKELCKTCQIWCASLFIMYMSLWRDLSQYFIQLKLFEDILNTRLTRQITTLISSVVFFFSQSNRYESQPHFHSIRAWELVNILCCHSIIFDSNSARAHRDWKWRMTPQEEVSICSLHASRGSVQDNHVMYHSYCCNAAAATLIFSVAAVREWESSKRSPSSCSPHHSTHSALLQSVTQRNALQHTYTHTHPKAIWWQIQIYTKTLLLQWM